MNSAKNLRPFPRHSGVIRLLSRPTSREWLLQLAGTDDHRGDQETDRIILRRLNRALAAPGDPRQS